MARATPAAAPTAADLAALLGPAHEALQALLAENPALRPEWKHYGARLGWSLKLFQGRRNLCFVSPRPGQLLIGFVLGAKAAGAALADPALPEPVKRELRAARRYAEGQGVRVVVEKPADLGPVRRLLSIKASS